MSRTFAVSNPFHSINATTLAEPFLQIVVTPEGIKVHMRSERMRAHGFVLKSDDEARLLIAELQNARNVLATMPPSAADTALAEVRALTTNGHPAA